MDKSEVTLMTLIDAIKAMADAGDNREKQGEATAKLLVALLDTAGALIGCMINQARLAGRPTEANVLFNKSMVLLTHRVIDASSETAWAHKAEGGSLN